MRRALPLLLFSFSLAAQSAAQDAEPRSYADGIVAVVEGEPITRRELELACLLGGEEYRRLAPGDSTRRFELQSQHLELLIGERVLLLKAAAEGIELTAADDARVLAAIERQSERWGGREALRQSLEQLGVPFDFYLNHHRGTLLIQKLESKSISQDIFITPAEIRRYYLEHQSRFSTRGEVRVQQIVVQTDPDLCLRDPLPPLVRQAIQAGWNPRAYAESLLAKVQQGQPFEQVALEGSMGTDYDQPQVFSGGTRPEQVLVSPLGEVVNRLRPGEVSDIVETRSGSLHLLYLAERREAGTLPLSEVQDEIRRTLEQSVWQRRVSDWRQEQIQAAFVRRFLRPPQ